MEGYHSPQVDVAVRLNTNESPYPPPAEWQARVSRGDRRDRLAPLSRSRRHRVAGPHRRPARCRARAGVRGQRVERGAADAAARLRRRGSHGRGVGADLRPALPHRAGGRHRGRGRRAGARLLDRPRRGAPGVRRGGSVGRVPVLAQQPDRHGRRRRDRPGRARAGRASTTRLLVVDEAYGQFAPRSALSMVDDDLPLVVTRTYSKTWAMAAARLGYLVGPRWVVEQLDKIVLPYHLDAFTQIAGHDRARLRRRDGGARRPPRRGTRPPGRPARRATRSTCGRRAPTSCCSARGSGRATRPGRRCSIGACSCGTARRGLASRAVCGSRSAPPAEDDAFLDALTEILR